MLTFANRLTSREDFARVTKSSIRTRTKSLSGYLTLEEKLTEPKIGFIVSRVVGGSVSRHRISRKLRHVARESLHLLPKNSMVVVRINYKECDIDRELPELLSSLRERSSTKVAR